jgi:hypothetical protein
MKSVYVVTMWSGGRPAKKWKSGEEPKALPQGTGVEFINSETRLRVQVIGSISIEQYESGKEEFETRIGRESTPTENRDDFDPEPPPEGSNIRRIY